MAFPLLAAAIPSIISGVSSLFGASKKRKAQQELQNYQRSLRLDPVTGQFGQIGVEDGNIDAGAFGDLQSMFSGGANQVLGGTDFGAGLPPEVAQAFSMLQSRMNPSADPSLGAGNQSDMMRQLFGGASGLAGQLGQSFDSTRDSTLGLLRSQAMPGQQRAVDSTLSRLFAQGRLGSTGGANIMGRLAESQNQQDLGFQLAAGGEARAASADTMNRFQSLFSGGQTAFGNLQGLEQEGYDRTGQNLAATTGLQSLPTDLQSGRVGLAQNLMGGATNIQDMLMQAFGGALNKATAATNVRVAGAGLNTQAQAAPGYSASPMADAFGNLGAGMSTPQSGQALMQLFQNLFKR
ncbi:MAG: hypothetical protein A3E01_07130 [Gammaproteobacteria bacterium RIFCSPHIGHO2_12_FULL_63_22]|nr:MAG: hypothetical protein A3E01_07130 [Gammaproteobacteria bacterium RIFCSPHIGHO2_12_FULL_63_22]